MIRYSVVYQLSYGMSRDCKHECIIYDNGESVCSRCGLVIAEKEEVIESYWDEHGKTDLWHLGLGGLNKGKRDDISIISNICNKLGLTSVQSYQAYIEYLRLLKLNKISKGTCLLLALHKVARDFNMRLANDITEIIRLNMDNSIELEEADIAIKFARKSRLKLYNKVRRWI